MKVVPVILKSITLMPVLPFSILDLQTHRLNDLDLLQTKANEGLSLQSKVDSDTEKGNQ